MKDLISVIVPVYNIAPYLPRSISSILAQTYSRLEVIAVDDGSSDDSLAMLHKLAAQDARIRVIHQENGGVTQARLTGVAAAKGEWIGFVDGDDEIEPDMYERLLHNAEEYHADISHCGYQMVFPDHVDEYYNTGRVLAQDRQSGLLALIDGSFVEPTLCSKLFRKRLFEKLLDGAMDRAIRNTEDLLMNFYLFYAANAAVYEDVCPYHYMVRKSSAATSGVNEHKLRDPLSVLKTIKRETAGDELLQRTVNGRIAACLIGLATIPLGNQRELIQPYRDSARKELRELVPELMRGGYSGRTRLLSAWAALWPWSYAAVHRVYARLKGTDRKYEVR